MWQNNTKSKRSYWTNGAQVQSSLRRWGLRIDLQNNYYCYVEIFLFWDIHFVICLIDELKNAFNMHEFIIENRNKIEINKIRFLFSLPS